MRTTYTYRTRTGFEFVTRKPITPPRTFEPVWRRRALDPVATGATMLRGQDYTGRMAAQS